MTSSKQTVSLQELVEKGFLKPLKRGRPSLYATDEERLAVHKTQQQACVRRRVERVKQAFQRMHEAATDVITA